jgi:tungstate transport system substrate-binding protein
MTAAARSLAAGWLLLVATACWAAEPAPFITVASTTSTENSGLFAYLLPIFQRQTGIEVHVVALGTGQALKTAARGDADVVFVHDKEAEDKFIAEGFGIGRREVMYNDFLIVGPKNDPAGIRGMHDAPAAFRTIAEKKAPFVSRGDDSGTYMLERRLWQAAGLDPKSASRWYRESGEGMGAVLNTAAGMDAYTLTDRATWLSFKNRGNLEALVEGDPRLFNQYRVMLVNPARYPQVKRDLGQRFIDWLTSPAGQQAIASYKIDGAQLFFPDANRSGS